MPSSSRRVRSRAPHLRGRWPVLLYLVARTGGGERESARAKTRLRARMGEVVWRATARGPFDGAGAAGQVLQAYEDIEEGGHVEGLGAEIGLGLRLGLGLGSGLGLGLGLGLSALAPR